jgi:hypothetical protein
MASSPVPASALSWRTASRRLPLPITPSAKVVGVMVVGTQRSSRGFEQQPRPAALFGPARVGLGNRREASHFRQPRCTPCHGRFSRYHAVKTPVLGTVLAPVRPAFSYDNLRDRPSGSHPDVDGPLTRRRSTTRGKSGDESGHPVKGNGQIITWASAFGNKQTHPRCPFFIGIEWCARFCTCAPGEIVCPAAVSVGWWRNSR